MKKIMSVVLAVCLFIGLSATLTACNPKYSSERYVSLSINPMVEFVVDKENRVEAVNAANADAETLIVATDFIGMDLVHATEKFVELATAAGYIDVDSQENQVTVTVIGENDEEKTEKSLEDTIYKYFENNGIYGRVSRDTLDEYTEQAAGLDVSTGKMKMIMRALDMDADYAIEELAAMPVKDLVRLFNDKAKDDYGATLRAEYKAEKAVIRDKYEALGMLSLESEISTLATQIADFVGSDEDKAALETQLAEKRDEYDVLKVAYDAEIKALNDDYKLKREEHKAQRKAALEDKVNENRQKNSEHKQDFEKNKKEIKEKIRKWRETQAA